MKKNLIENLRFPLIIKVDYDILLKTLKILVRCHVNDDIYNFYELTCLLAKELTFFSEIVEPIPRAEIRFINVVEENDIYFIDIELSNSNFNIKILCKEFEWKLLARSY